jgi:hypothetical protein
MTNRNTFALLSLPFVLVAWPALAEDAGSGAPSDAAVTDAVAATETECHDGVDNDGDTVTDCADNDCKHTEGCEPDGKPENTEARCSDWIDNDKDGVPDCDDAECQRLPVCQGSWQGPVDGDGTSSGPLADGGNAPAGEKFAPDTEQADSNDGVGFVGVRFGVVASVLQELDVNNTKNGSEFVPEMDTRINLLQLRAFGALPLLEDSFFLINLRGERSPRLTFAMFQVPIGGGHYMNVNTGGGSLSNALIISAAKQPLLEPAFYMTSAFEQGNGAAVEISGPIILGKLRYRTFLGGGAGFSTGNIGGRRFTFDNFNYTYTVGAQLQSTPIGITSRFDSQYLYRPVPMAMGVNFGAKYDQRQQERYPAVNASVTFRWGYFEAMAEDYFKTELNFGAIQNAYNLQVGALIVPEVLFAAADFGQFWTSDFGEIDRLTGFAITTSDPDQLETQLRNQRGETQARVALHWYFWRNNGVLSLRYKLRLLDPPLVGPDKDRVDLFQSHETWLAAQFRF